MCVTLHWRIIRLPIDASSRRLVSLSFLLRRDPDGKDEGCSGRPSPSSKDDYLPHSKAYTRAIVVACHWVSAFASARTWAALALLTTMRTKYIYCHPLLKTTILLWRGSLAEGSCSLRIVPFDRWSSWLLSPFLSLSLLISFCRKYFVSYHALALALALALAHQD